MAKGYTCWLLNEGDRAVLLATFKPAYDNVVAHHITDRFGVDDSVPLPKGTTASVIGIADDGQGVQALVVAVYDGYQMHEFRDDGKRYHVTWSLANGRKAVQSNNVIAEGFAYVKGIYQFQVTPTFFPF